MSSHPCLAHPWQGFSMLPDREWDWAIRGVHTSVQGAGDKYTMYHGPQRQPHEHQGWRLEQTLALEPVSDWGSHKLPLTWGAGH
jgi:hypothetical protein